MKLVFIGILFVLLMAITVQGYFLWKERNELQGKIGDLISKAEKIVSDNNNLTAEIKYLSIPENLEKELRARFNYRKPDEKMMIIVP